MSKKLEKVRIKLVNDGELTSDKEIRNYKDAIALAREYIVDSNHEIVCAICLAGGKPINFMILSMGSSNFSYVPVGELIKTALLSNANGIILLHNHPYGSCTPSSEDIAVTDKLIKACELIDMKLLDHIIVPANSDMCFSFMEKGLIQANLNEYTINLSEISFQNVAENDIKHHRNSLKKNGR